jgi:hypothetical protein
MKRTNIDEHLTGDDYNNIASLCGCTKDYAQKICRGDRDMSSEVARKVYELGKKAAELNESKFKVIKKFALSL